MATVINRHKEKEDVYIGRGSIWGNPFPLPKYTREESIAKYKIHLWQMIQSGKVTKQMLKDLEGKRLGCYCKPKACHGDIIVQAITWAIKKENQCETM